MWFGPASVSIFISLSSFFSLSSFSPIRDTKGNINIANGFYAEPGSSTDFNFVFQSLLNISSSPTIVLPALVGAEYTKFWYPYASAISGSLRHSIYQSKRAFTFKSSTYTNFKFQGRVKTASRSEKISYLLLCILRGDHVLLLCCFFSESSIPQAPLFLSATGISLDAGLGSFGCVGSPEAWTSSISGIPFRTSEGTS